MGPTAKRQLSVRLTVLIAAVVTVFLLIGGAAAADSPPPPAIEYTVSSGDTLWAIAAQNSGPDQDIRNVIRAIRQASDLEGSDIFPGQVLVIPQL